LADEDDLESLNQVVDRLTEQGKYKEAIPIAERAVEAAKRTRGPEHAETAYALSNLGWLFQEIGEYAEAEPLLKEVLRIRQKVLGPENPDTATDLDKLGELYHYMGEYAKAEPLLQEALRIRQKVLGLEDLYTATSLNNLAELSGQLLEAPFPTISSWTVNQVSWHTASETWIPEDGLYDHLVLKLARD
jgi:tetratricopeptide (TPR) repeat protein